MCTDSLQEGTDNTENNIMQIDTSDEDKNRIEFIALEELSCGTARESSLDDQKKNLIEEFKAIVENSIETEEELKLVKNHLKQLIPTLKATKLASGRSLQVLTILIGERVRN